MKNYSVIYFNSHFNEKKKKGKEKIKKEIILHVSQTIIEIITNLFLDEI